MDDKLKRTIGQSKTWDELRQLEANIKARGALSEQVVSAIQERATELGLELVREKTGLVLDDLTPAERKIVLAISEYVGVKQRQGRYPSRTFTQVRSRGLLDAAESAVSRASPAKGFQELADADLEDLSYEQIVVDHPEEFSPRAQWFSRRTLGLPNASDSPPASTHSDTQTRTATLLKWLKERADADEGYLPQFTNADAAVAMDMEDMQRYGQVHGNIQSRIDFACFKCGLPPLGCAADAPFSKAWSQQARSWAFPVSDMQAAAQGRVWSADDFDQILRETEQLPGQAHLSWKDALANDEASVKAWALGFTTAAPLIGEQNGGGYAAVRNPVWSRDELILALDLYLRHRASPPGKESAEVAELSEFLNQMGRTLGRVEADTFRNANGVYMKMMNFRRFDPEYIRDGRKGLTRGNKDEEVVWSEFADDLARLALVCSAIRSAVSQHAHDHDLAGEDEPDISEAPEGRVLTRMHRYRERSRKLVEAAKKQAIAKTGRLTCEACKFDFTEKYGVVGTGIIDVHHTRPVHTLVEGDKTKLEDLALLCANCHRVVHSKREWLTVSDVAELVQKPR